MLSLLPSLLSSPLSETYIIFCAVAPAPTHVNSPESFAPMTDPIPGDVPCASRNVPPICTNPFEDPEPTGLLTCNKYSGIAVPIPTLS